MLLSIVKNYLKIDFLVEVLSLFTFCLGLLYKMMGNDIAMCCNKL
jgi:hypothetical protein